MDDGVDFIAICRPGMVLRTRDRRYAAISRVDPTDGLIHGEVRMVGPCVWRSDGRFREAPAGAAGPLDLVPPGAGASAPAQPTASLREALDPANRRFCCD